MILEIVILLATLVLYAYVFTKLGDVIEDSKKRKFYQWSFLKIILAFLPLWIVVYVQLYYGFRWMCKGRTRHNFIAYYRLTITSGCSQLIVILILDMIILVSSTAVSDDVIRRALIYNFIYFCFEASTLVFVHLYMKYLDTVHQVKNDVARAKQDFNY